MPSFNSAASCGLHFVLRLRVVASAAILGLTVAGASACGGVDVGMTYPTGYDGDYPPDSFIATSEPFYYGGYASYWYGGRWYYRDGGGRWNHYDREPEALRQRRAQGAPARHSYAPSRGGRTGGRSGGGRSGGHR